MVQGNRLRNNHQRFYHVDLPTDELGVHGADIDEEMCGSWVFAEKRQDEVDSVAKVSGNVYGQQLPRLETLFSPNSDDHDSADFCHCHAYPVPGRISLLQYDICFRQDFVPATLQEPAPVHQDPGNKLDQDYGVGRPFALELRHVHANAP